MFNKNKLCFAAVTVAMFVMQTVQGEVIDKTIKIRGTTIHYKVVLPNGYDPARRYPAVIALGGGSQNMATVNGVLNRYLRARAASSLARTLPPITANG